MAASAGKAIAELHGVGLAVARAEALGHIWVYSRNIPALLRLGDERIRARVLVPEPQRSPDIRRPGDERDQYPPPPAKLQMLVRVGRTSQPGLSPRRDLSAFAQPR